tara:strand:- start:329 stop:508 length:180 start_codon:yes stop_codon:yes gene_type:complete
MDSKSIEEIVGIIERKIAMMIIEQLPNPSCPRKRDHNNWKIEQVKQTLAERLNDKSRAK